MRRDHVASTLRQRHFGTKCPLGRYQGSCSFGVHCKCRNNYGKKRILTIKEPSNIALLSFEENKAWCFEENKAEDSHEISSLIFRSEKQ